jgi:very-short-patch-repair endonuclease
MKMPWYLPAHTPKSPKGDHRTMVTGEFERYGITVLRFTNDEVFTNIEKVRDIIASECEKLLAQ